MKKINIYNIIFISCITIYLIFLILNLCGIEQFAFVELFWFQIFLCIMGILVLTRGILFKIDSSVFAGITLILLSVVFLIRDIYVLSFLYILPLIVSSISIGFIVVYFCYKNKLYLKLFLYSLIIIGLSCLAYIF